MHRKQHIHKQLDSNYSEIVTLLVESTTQRKIEMLLVEVLLELNCESITLATQRFGFEPREQTH